MIAFAAHTSYYNKRFNKILYFIVMGTSEHFLYLTTMLCMKECLYACVTHILHVCNLFIIYYLFIIICNCIYIVVINCGWNNNVAVKIVAC